MSTFKVFYGGTSNYDQEFEGTKRAGALFNNYWTQNGPGQKIFEDFIIGLVGSGLIVTYKDDLNPDNRVFVKNTGGANHVFYKSGGQDKQINVKAEKDNPNNDVVTMAVPSVAADPDTGDTKDYLNNALTKLTDQQIHPDEKREFLFGLLLLKRCR
jgi:hypothetical protein